jgi:hypothetical protein
MKKRSPRRASRAEKSPLRAEASATEAGERGRLGGDGALAERRCANTRGDDGKNIREQFSARAADFPPTSPVRLAAIGSAGFDEFSTESALAIARNTLGEPIATRFRQWAELLDRQGQRYAAVRAACALWPAMKPTPASKRLASELDRYVCGAWLRECDSGPPPGATELRVLLHRIARLARDELDGDRTLSDRQIRNILASGK